MEDILLGKVFRRDSRKRVSLRLMDQEKPFVSLDIEELDGYMKGLGNGCLFIPDLADAEKLTEYSVDERFLKNFLTAATAEDIQDRIREYSEILKKLPKGLTSILVRLPGREGLRNFLQKFLKMSKVVEPWEDSISSSLELVERREMKTQRIDIQKAIRLVFSEGGLLQDLLPEYEYRQEQFMASLEIAESIVNENGIMIEAGTGTGKSMAYLAPIAYACASTTNQAVVATRTRVLQDQLVKKDLPVIKQLPNLKDLRSVSLKGRERYLCLRKLYENIRIVSNGMLARDTAWEIFGVILWSILTPDGDLDSLALEDDTRMTLAGNRFDCTRRLCPLYDACPYYVARDNARNADIVVTNHSLLFSEANLRIMDGEEEDFEALGTLLPSFRYLVVDEAHEVENSLTQAMSFTLDPAEVVSSLKKVIKSVRSCFGFLKRHFDEEFLRKLWAKMNTATEELEGIMRELVERGRTLSSGEKRAFTKETLPELVEILFKMADRLQIHIAVSGQTIQMLEDVREQSEGKGEELSIILKALHAELREWARQIAGITAMESSKVVYIHKQERLNGNGLKITSSPVQNDRIMSSVFPNVKVKIFISATLWVYSKGSDGFNYARRVIGAREDYPAIRLGTSFDYTQQLKFFVPSDMPDYRPNSLSYLESASQFIETALSIVGGGSLVLFTSYDDMKTTAARIEKNLEGITVNIQERNDSPAILLAEHINSKRSVIFGTRVFWEGIDLPGEQLKLLIVYKLPFERPDEPLIEARIKHYGPRNPSEGMNKYYYPKMITAFRQGIGRLIRSKRDHGVVIVLDARLVDPNRPYSKKLLASMTPGIEIQSARSNQIFTRLRSLKKEGWL